MDSLARVEEYTKKKIEIGYLEDADLAKDFKPMRSEEFGFKKGFERDRDSKSHHGGRGGPDRGHDRGGKPSRGPNDRRNDRPLKGGPDRRPARAGLAPAPALGIAPAAGPAARLGAVPGGAGRIGGWPGGAPNFR